MLQDLTSGTNMTGGECAHSGLDGSWDGSPLCEGLKSWSLHLVVTQVIPAGSGPDKESSRTVHCWSETFGKV